LLLSARPDAVSEPDARGMRTVLARLNGQLRPLDVRDDSIEVQSVAVERADPGNPGHVGAPDDRRGDTRGRGRRDAARWNAVAMSRR
jgi:pyruvate carboxylase